MISVFTPTNNPEWLRETYESLCSQTYRDWEWIVLGNGDIKWSPQEGKQVKVYHSREKNVGALKREAAQYCSGDILVELDHDDLLTSDALQKIADAFEDPEIGFVYSNHAVFWDKTYEPFFFSPMWGWEYREVQHYGKTYQEALGWPPDPMMMSLVYFCPNHVRVWRKDAYWEAGGHDPKRLIIDDHDLVCRTYLVTRFKYIDECLYLQRFHNKQSFREYNQEIQDKTREVRYEYLPKLVKRWCEINKYPMIDICSNGQAPEGYIGLDIMEGVDLEKDWPLDDNSVGVVRAMDALEHLSDKTHAMNEAYRVLVPGGWLLSETPSTDGRGAFQDPTHKSYWNENCLWYYTNPNYSKWDDKIKCKFIDSRAHDSNTYFPTDWHREQNISYVIGHLVAYKGQRTPGVNLWQETRS